MSRSSGYRSEDTERANADAPTFILIDQLFLKRERTSGLKFVSGRFSIKWAGTKCTMMTELYFKDQSDKWKKEEIACERPSDIFTAESWRRLEKQKEVTAKSAIHECFPGGCISCILPDFFCSVLRHLIFLTQKSPTPSDQSDPNSQRSTCSNIYGASVKSSVFRTSLLDLTLLVP